MGHAYSRLWKAIEESEIKREVIAKKSGLTVKTLGQIMRGKTQATEEQKKRIATQLKQSVSELFDNVGGER